MKDDTSIFIITEEGLLDINKPEARNTTEYKNIITRDKGSKGDHEGRKKAQAFKELIYVHLVVHPNSKFRDLPDTVRREKARVEAKLEDDWEEDDLIKAALIKYEEDIALSALHYSYINANRAVYGVGEDLAYFNSRRSILRDNITFNTNKLNSGVDEEEESRLHTAINKDTNTLLDIGERILKLSNTLTGAFDTIESLKQRLVKEGQKGAELYGGGKLGNREK